MEGTFALMTRITLELSCTCMNYSFHLVFSNSITISGCQLDFVKKERFFLKGSIFKKKGFCNKKRSFGGENG